MRKDYDPPVAARVSKEDDKLLIELAYARGFNKSRMIREALHEYCEEVRKNRKALQDSNEF